MKNTPSVVPGSPIKIMGILNTTPDSFSDGGNYNSVDKALAQAEKLIADGADIIDIGGESTRPGSLPVSLAEELQRVIPVISALHAISAITISIDTTKAEVARQALLAGAHIINDISALSMDEAMVDVLQDSTADVVLMHMQGRPETMQNAPVYDNVTEEVYHYFEKRIEWLEKKGISRKRIIVDPGIGFGKTLQHNIELLKNLDFMASLGSALLLGHSRKRFLGAITGRDTGDRDLATAVTAALCASQKMDIVRVHNVAATRDALLIAEALRKKKL
ncbi:dihydropteroate synthase [Desulfotalea psychrophila]|uniref:Dihydropteroate synthase n=1 Tax=Desulfotalea psychrophila (strain LSv54 / DSM 12343) TaxID=177439 RepID=Q6AIK3_DESPS|nr:dihydropteroate synthase [Desulfotalea psychrophila]CAG37827.1 related to dihydropteroate synthase [Desulfotalea psychrophila LSv54]